MANEAIDGFISWILDLIRLGKELDVEENENLHFGCGTPLAILIKISMKMNIQEIWGSFTVRNWWG